MKSHNREKVKGRKESGTFLKVPTAVLCCPNYCALSLKARALILDIGARFNGFNNGDLAAPYSWMQSHGWRSKDTLHRALKELQQAGLIELTRQGGLHGPSLYAFTWLAIDASKAHPEIGATRVASGNWNRPMAAANDALKIDLPPRPSGKTAPTIGLDQQKKAAK